MEHLSTMPTYIGFQIHIIIKLGETFKIRPNIEACANFGCNWIWKVREHTCQTAY